MCRFCTEVADDPPPASLTTFSPLHEKVVCHLRFFTEVAGLHTVNILWFTPSGAFFFNSEAVLWRPPRYPHRHVDVWGWLDLQERPLTPGNWTVLIVVSGIVCKKRGSPRG